MTERLRHLSLLALSALWLAACASTPQVNPALAASLSAHGVDQGTYDKITQGRVLDYNDIQALLRKKVPTSIIIGYLQSTRKAYDFSYSQLQGLKAAGASPQLLNYLTETQGFYGVRTTKQAARLTGEQRRAYFNTPGYQSQGPFNTPLIEEWADPAYEESLYSPFSFN
ncbi:MAG TPA: hypothetical protein VMS23_01085 [Terrimicrobiaceae bacterium]|jgi:hypothetical protein|nr:hypothetical protein [Terrimicrobiaceae bacterium]